MESNLKNIIIGLGNPGSEYAETRHNTGFRVLDLLAEKAEKRFKKSFFRPFLFAEYDTGQSYFILIKPMTYMNRSGQIIPLLYKKWLGENYRFIIVCDNMDLQPGEIRIKQKGSSAGHNGIKSMLEYLDTDQFIRVFIGVGRPSSGENVVDHVLGRASEGAAGAILKAEERAVLAVESLAVMPLPKVMNEFNRKQA